VSACAIGADGAVFLDRDGTINVKADEGSYITSPAELALLPGAARAIRRINDCERKVLVVTNQRGVARGVMSAADLDEVNSALQRLLESEAGAHVDGFYSCTHHAGECDCRKPLPGLINRAASEHQIDVSQSAMIGDAESDVAAGRAAGVAQLIQLGVDWADLGAAIEALGI
jgi:D-glycero-D-manno-heptose 1,7-bisphosphate phosphatase